MLRLDCPFSLEELDIEDELSKTRKKARFSPLGSLKKNLKAKKNSSVRAKEIGSAR